MSERSLRAVTNCVQLVYFNVTRAAVSSGLPKPYTIIKKYLQVM